MLHAELRVYQQIVEGPDGKEEDGSEPEAEEQQAGEDESSPTFLVMTGEGDQVADALTGNGKDKAWG